MEKNELRLAILAKIQPPKIPEKTVNAERLEILPGTGEDLTEPIQKAIDELSAAGGGRLIFPAGIYRTGALRLRSGVELHLEKKNTVLSFIADPDSVEEKYPLVYSHWEASPCWNYSALLYAFEEKDIALTGCGVLDGGADTEHWWNWHHQVEESWSDDRPDLQLNDRRELRHMNQSGIAVDQRRFGAGHFLRPNFVQLIRCERVLLQGVTLRKSPMWQLNPVFCKSVTVDGMTLSSHGYNNDGCDPESCNGVWIKNCCFDTGDDCISLKSGRDRDGMISNTPCENVLIENNEFADGHGGIALGSEMSGGIRNVLACDNRFSSPNLTYALRLKTNARRGGFVEQVMLCDSQIDQLHGAAVHGTMLYEDGRNGTSLPVFRNITVENITAHGGDYGIFLEAFPEVPISGLVLRNIRIDDAKREMRAMNWKNPIVENVWINGKPFPRPCAVRVLGVPSAGEKVYASAEGEKDNLSFSWEISKDQKSWTAAGAGCEFTVPENASWIRLTACDKEGRKEMSAPYRVLPTSATGNAARLACRNMLPYPLPDNDKPITRSILTKMLMPLADRTVTGPLPVDTAASAAILAVANRFFPLDAAGRLNPEQTVTREEMASVAMQACGVNYRNASTTMPVCNDVQDVANNFGTNVARALYFGFMELENGRFFPKRLVTVGEAIGILNRVADFAGL